jgi:hypothetical protein
MASKVVYNNSGRQVEGFRIGDVVRTPSFSTKDGDYTHCVDQLYSRPTRTPYYPAYSISVHVSVGLEDYILFNVGSEAFVYSLAAPGEKVFVKETIDKWNGKSGMIPLCHDVNDIAITSDLLPVILGFKTGLIVYYNPLKKKNLAMLNHNVCEMIVYLCYTLVSVLVLSLGLSTVKHALRDHLSRKTSHKICPYQSLFPHGCFLNTNFIHQGIRVRGGLGFSIAKRPGEQFSIAKHPGEQFLMEYRFFLTYVLPVYIDPYRLATNY